MPENDAEQADPAILCLDTCSILDILRYPLRPQDLKVEEHEANLRLLRIAELGIDIEVRMACVVREEYKEHVDRIQDHADDSFTGYKNGIHKFDRLVNLHGNDGTIDLEHWEGHVQRCRNAADRWMQVAKIVPTPSYIVNRAFTRVRKRLRPAKTGNESMKDCVILETYLDYVSKIDRSSSRKVVFVSSNTSDFANDRGNEVADELRSEFNTLGLDYAPNMRKVGGLLGL